MLELGRRRDSRERTAVRRSAQRGRRARRPSEGRRRTARPGSSRSASCSTPSAPCRRPTTSPSICDARRIASTAAVVRNVISTEVMPAGAGSPVRDTSVVQRHDRQHLACSSVASTGTIARPFTAEPAAVDGKDDAVHVVGRRRAEEDERARESSGSPQRPAGMRSRICSKRTASSRSASVLSVAM